MVLLGTRPGGVTPRFQVLGRETFLAPVEWIGPSHPSRVTLPIIER
jgi:hypothetical protein